MRVGAAQPELARDKGARFLPPGYSYVSHQTWARRFSGAILPVGAYFSYNGQDHLWWLGNVSVHTPTPGQQYVVRVFHDPGPVKLTLSSARYTTALGAVRGSWCLQMHKESSLMRDIVHNVDESRGADLASSTDLDTSPWSTSVFALVSVVNGAGVVVVSVFSRFSRSVILWVFCCCLFTSTPVFFFFF